ncbi:MAG: CHAT domain-containing protein [Bacteroidales bacterium]|jgi:CHAT domain-containing protein|nr:CHAT domain-containing protein [Bacteroidales bacterium]
MQIFQRSTCFRNYLLSLSLKAAIASFIFLLSCATPSIRVTREQNQGDFLFNNHNYQEAVEHYNLMLDASRKLGIYRNRSMESEVHRKIANCYEMGGDYKEALSHVKISLVIDSLENNLAGRIAGYRHEGKIFIYMGLSRNGIISLEKSLSLSEGMEQSLKNVNKISIADNYLVIGQLYSVMGMSEKSIDYTGKAFSLFSLANDLKGEMESDLTLANIRSDLGDIEESRRLVESSLMKASALGLGTSRHNQLLASVATESGEYENALRYQEKALSEAKDFGIMGQVIWTTIGMGDIYSRLGDFNKAEKFYRDARSVRDTLKMETKSLDASLNLRLGEIVSANEYFSSQGFNTGEAISSLRIGEMLMLKGKQDSAIIFLNQAEEKFTSAENREGVSNVLLLKGRILVDADDPEAARPMLESATRVTDFPETVWQAWFHLGRMYEKLNQDEKAVESYRNSIAVIEKIRGSLTIDEFKSTYFETKREVYDYLLRILLKMDKPVEAFQVSEQARARAFYDILANKKIDFKGSVSGDLISLEQSKRTEIQKLYKLLQKGDVSSYGDESTRNSGLNQLRETLITTQTEYEDILRRIKLHNPAYAEMVTARPIDITALRAGLDEKTAVLTYWISKNELIYWLITKSEIIYKIIPVSEKTLSSMIEKTRRSIQSNSFDDARRNLSLLYSYLIAPVEKNIVSFPDLILIPNGSLHFLPFQALISSRGEYLVQRYNLLYAPSASVFMVCSSRQAKQGSRFMGMALSDFAVEDKTGLPGTEDEVRKILPLFPDNISAFGKQSTETFVKKNASGYDFIHFATHGSYNYDQPLYSHLLFPQSDDDDGRLNVFEVFELNINANLVTLSACETGLGNISQGDELVGLSRAFLFAGSSSVIVSLWAVADYPTSILMTNFYRYLKDHNLQEALTLAQRDVIKIYPQPQYWAPFVLIGNGNVKRN